MTYPEAVFASRLRVRKLPKLALLLTVLAHCGLFAWAAEPITGTVTNKTNGKPAVGDPVVLIQLQQGMQESTRTTTDAHGRFTLVVPDDGIHLVRVTHQKAAYFQPVQPDQHNVAVTVYDAAPSVPGVGTGVEELHIEATPTELHVVEVLQVLNNSTPPRTQFGPNGYEFYLPRGSLIGRTGAITQGGMPVQTPAVPRADPGHYSFLFPLRPGETQFGIAYTMPYTGSYTFTPQLTSAVKTFAVILPASMKVTPGLGSLLARQPGKPGTQTLIAQDVPSGNGPQFTVAGTGTMPEAGTSPNGAGPNGAAPNGTSQNAAGPNASTANPGANSDASAPTVSNSPLAGGRGLNEPLDEAGDRDPWAKYKWWILSGLALLLAAAAGFFLRKPGGTAALSATAPQTGEGGMQPTTTYPTTTHPTSSHRTSSHQDAILAALKEELFLIETERLQRHISEDVYRTLKSAMEVVLGRVLRRTLSTEVSAPAPLPEQPNPDTALSHTLSPASRQELGPDSSLGVGADPRDISSPHRSAAAAEKPVNPGPRNA